MSFFKNVLSDLVEKRLWPVAIALVAALVAVPIVLGGGSDDAGTPVASATAGTATTAGTSQSEVISLEEQAAGKVQRAGSLKNPFVQHHQPKVTTTSTTATTSTTSSPSTSSSSGSGSSGGTPASTGGTTDTPSTTKTTPSTTPKTTTTPAAASDDTYRVDLTFGESGAEKKHANVARLTPLPSSDNPFFVYLGLADDKQSAIFLVDADAVPTGDGKCTPSDDSCEQVALKEGDVEFFDLQSGTAGVVQYSLTLDAIKKVKASTTASAAQAHARESKAGREYLRQLVSDDPTALDGWDYSKSLGLLISKDPQTTPDVANVPSTLAGAADGQAVGSTSTVLTVPGS
jgi:hypothetical protein